MKVPQSGEIVSYSLPDSVGRIRLGDGSEVRFGASALGGLVPVLGMRVIVRSVVEHPLGGFKAVEIALAEGGEAAYQEKASAFGAAAAAEIEAGKIRLEHKQERVAAAVQPEPLTEQEAHGLAELKKLREAEARVRCEADEAAERLRLEACLLFKNRPDPEAWAALLALVGLEGGAAARVLALARPAALLAAVPSDAAVDRGDSKLGGEPDLPGGTAWPTSAGRPLAFLGQVRLSAVPAAVRGSLSLPPEGLLSFFYDALGQPRGLEPADRGGACVCLWPQIERLARVAPPPGLAAQGRFREVRLRLLEELRLPGVGSPAFDALGLEPAAVDAYLRALDAYAGVREDAAHSLGGHALPIQGAMEEDLAPALREAGDWRLLLQLDSDERMGATWGDGGRLFFWLREDDLRALRFDQAWCILQRG